MPFFSASRHTRGFFQSKLSHFRDKFRRAMGELPPAAGCFAGCPPHFTILPLPPHVKQGSINKNVARQVRSARGLPTVVIVLAARRGQKRVQITRGWCRAQGQKGGKTNASVVSRTGSKRGKTNVGVVPRGAQRVRFALHGERLLSQPFATNSRRQ